ncbi:hypothetical protein BRCH_02424c [Candidatus Burkholderia brachyanthoides]|nr:hypothetical protein BRCH_02424c [Candidatus Burkholderia brachyanthoides]
MKSTLQIVLLHAYSRRNSGDGPLVDLSATLLREALGPHIALAVRGCGISIVSRVCRRVVCTGHRGKRCNTPCGCRACRVPYSCARLTTLRDRLACANLIVGVGGGYLRARDGIEAAKLRLGHLVQADAARAASKPTIYLPQSVGPALGCTQALSDCTAARLRTALSRFDAICVRDDRSHAFLDGHANVTRMPDLAVLEFARSSDTVLAHAASRKPRIEHVALVLRDAPSWSRAQRERLCDIDPSVDCATANGMPRHLRGAEQRARQR